MDRYLPKEFKNYRYRLWYHLGDELSSCPAYFCHGCNPEERLPIEIVSKMLGHTKIITTQIYAEVDEEKIGADMSAVERRLNRWKKKL